MVLIYAGIREKFRLRRKGAKPQSFVTRRRNWKFHGDHSRKCQLFLNDSLVWIRTLQAFDTTVSAASQNTNQFSKSSQSIIEFSAVQSITGMDRIGRIRKSVVSENYGGYYTRINSLTLLS